MASNFRVKNTDLAKKVGEIDAQLEDMEQQKADKTTASNLQSQINSLVVNGTGDSNPEVIQSRTDINGYTFETAKSRLDNIEESIRTFTSTIAMTFSQGLVSSTDGNDTVISTRIKSDGLTQVEIGEDITINVANGYKANLVFYDAEGNYAEGISWYTGVKKYKSEYPYIRTSIAKTDDSAISPNEASNVIYSITFKNKEIYDARIGYNGHDFNNFSNRISNIESTLDLGYTELSDFMMYTGMLSSNGEVDKTNTSRIYTMDYIDISYYEEISFDVVDGYKIISVFYDTDKNIVKGISWQTGITSSIDISTYHYLRFTLAKIDDTPLGIEDKSNVKIRLRKYYGTLKNNVNIFNTEFKDNNTRLNAIESLISGDGYEFETTWENGLIYSTTGEELNSSKRIRTGFLQGDSRLSLVINPSNDYGSNIVFYDENKQYVSGITFSYSKTTVNLKYPYYRLCIRKKIESDMNISENINVSFKIIMNNTNETSNTLIYSPTNVPGYDGSGEDLSIPNQTVSNLYSKWDNLYTNHMNFMTREVLGKDQSGTYDIFQYEIKPPNPTIKILILAGLHGGNTPNGGGDPSDHIFGAYEFFNDLLTNWSENNALEKIMFNTHFVIMPCGNPWGIDNNARGNCRGVDLNRNFDYNWTSGGSGTAPFSEVESQYIRDVMIANADAKAYFDLHTYGDADLTFRWVLHTAPDTALLNNIHKATDNINANIKAPKGFSELETSSTSRMYMHSIIGIESVALEWCVYNKLFKAHSKQMMSLLTKWYGNIFLECIK